MNTAVQPVVPVENSRRIIPIFANLMPMEVVETRRGRRARRTTLVGLILLVAVLGGVYALTVLETSVARDDLASAQSRAAQLTRQQQQYAEVVRIQQESDQIERQLSALLAADLRWATVLSSVRGAAPSGVRLDSVAGMLIPKTEAAKTADQEKLPSASKAKPVGTLTISGTGPSKPVIAGYVDRLAKVAGVTDPYLSGVSQDDKNAWKFTLRLTITADAFGGRFTDPESKAGGN